MKTLKKISALVLLFALSFGINAQNYENEKLYLPGDNLNLYAVMNLFQESETLEGFERELNAADSKINNLDLNGDNLIDYIKVIDYVDGTTHSIVLQVAINQRENQDVAVFTVYRDKYDQVQIQLIGDEYLYGKDYIIEPYYAETPNPGYTGNTQVVYNKPAVAKTTYVYVNTWPVVRYIYTPTYVVYHSPWYWNYYPVYWNPWRPFYWDYYYGYHSHWHNHYYHHYRHSNHYYNNYYANNYYRGHRSYSSTVRTYREGGRYKNTYSRPDLRSKGSEEGRREYASAQGRTGRADGQNAGRTGQELSGRNDGIRPTTSAGRTSSPTTGRAATEVKSGRAATEVKTGRTATDVKTGRTANPRGTATPGVGRETGRTNTQAPARQDSKPAVRSTERQRTEVAAPRQEVSRPKAQAPARSESKPAVRSTERQRTEVTAPRQEVSRPKAQAPARQESKPAVRSSDNRSSRPSPAVKSSERKSAPAASRSTAPSRKSSSGEKRGNSGR
jgi:hypothetical protein